VSRDRPPSLAALSGSSSVPRTGLLATYPADLPHAIEVSTRVNSIAIDDPSLLEPDSEISQAA